MAPTVDQIVTFPHITLAAIVEAWLIGRLRPDLLPETVKVWIEQHNFLSVLFASLLINYVLFAFYCSYIYPFWLSPLRNVPSVKTSIRTRIKSVLTRNTHAGQFFLDLASTNYNSQGILLLRTPFIGYRLLVTGPKALQEILVTKPYDFEKPPQVRNFLRQVLGDGLVVVEGEQHEFQRKHVMPAFSFRHIKDLYPMMWQKAAAVTGIIETVLRESRAPAFQDDNYIGTIEVGEWASTATLDIIGVAGLGHEFNAMKNADDPLVSDYHELLRPDPERFLFFLAWAMGPQKLVARLPWKLNTTFKERTASLRNICRSLVRDKRAAIKTGSDEHFDILSLLIKSGDFSDEDLCDQLLTYLAAGHETTSSAFTWASFLLAVHPIIQTRLRDEVRQAIPTEALKDDNFSKSLDLASILESLPLLNAVSSETLRLYPTVPTTIRRAVRPSSVLSYPIPTGTDFLIVPFAVNRLPQLWGSDADQFKPERWISPDGKVNYHGGIESNYSFMTFLHGPRQCIGQGFARAELRCLIAAFVMKYQWELAMKEEDVVPGGVITIKPKNGLRLKLKAV